MIRLYDNAASSNAAKIRILLHELGLEFDAVEVTLGDQRADWYREIHPYATVPCLVDGEVVIPESNTALRYLADREGRDDLYPVKVVARARVDVILDSLSLQLRPLLWDVEETVLYGKPETPGARDSLRQGMRAWETLMADDAFCTGAFGIADCAVAGRLMHVDALPVDIDDFPRTARMLDAVRARPAYRAAMNHDQEKIE